MFDVGGQEILTLPAFFRIESEYLDFLEGVGWQSWEHSRCLLTEGDRKTPEYFPKWEREGQRQLNGC